MSSPFFERSNVDNRVGDHHDRIRNLEALVASGSDPSVCPDCVLDPFTVNLGDIDVPEAFWGCVDVGGLVTQFGTVCGAGLTTLVPEINFGFCSAYGLGTSLKLQVQINAALQSNMENLIIYAGPSGALSQVFSVFWDPAGNPNDSPASYESGWVTIDADLCGASCFPLAVAAAFTHHSVFFGGCVFGGFLGARWVGVDENGDFRGALDQLPQGDAFGDTLYFSTETKEFVEGPRSVPSRAIATFMGG